MTVPTHTFYAAKHADKSRSNVAPAVQPKWLKTLPQVYTLTAPLSLLLDHLPYVHASRNQAAIKTYFEKVTAELVKIYAYQLRIVDLSDAIPEKDKPAELNRLLEECNHHLATITHWLTYDGASK